MGESFIAHQPVSLWQTSAALLIAAVLFYQEFAPVVRRWLQRRKARRTAHAPQANGMTREII